MPRKRTGSCYKHGDHFDIRITLNDGSRSAPICLHGYSETRAREKAAHLTERARIEGATLIHAEKKTIDASTFGAWSDLWFNERESRGIKGERGRWGKWILDRAKLRDRKVASLKRADVEDIVSVLDAAIMSKNAGLGGIDWKTAWNVFGLVTRAFDDMAHAKDRTIRVREDNPAADVRGPERGTKKSKGWLHPRDFLAVMNDESIPVAHRRAVALAVYLYPRASELRALTFEDVHLEAGVVNFHHAELVSGEETSTKNDDSRRTPIEANLWPLLKAMHEERDGEGCVTTLPDDHHLARWLRDTLTWTGIERAELLKATRTRKAITWHDLRATGLTWRAIRGDDALKIMKQAGHKDLSTTMGYVREAEAIGADFGPVFPELPDALLKTNRQNVSGHFQQEARTLRFAARNRGIMVEAAGIEPEKTGSLRALSVPERVGLEDDPSATITNERTSTTSPGKSIDPLERALLLAAEAGRFDVVAKLADELHARRCDGERVVSLDAERARRGCPPK